MIRQVFSLVRIPGDADAVTVNVQLASDQFRRLIAHSQTFRTKSNLLLKERLY